MSQYDLRAAAEPDVPENAQGSQLLLGDCGDAPPVATAEAAARAIGLQPDSYCQLPDAPAAAHFAWIKSRVRLGYPIAIGVYINQYRLNATSAPDAGDADYVRASLLFSVSAVPLMYTFQEFLPRSISIAGSHHVGDWLLVRFRRRFIPCERRTAIRRSLGWPFKRHAGRHICRHKNRGMHISVSIQANQIRA